MFKLPIELKLDGFNLLYYDNPIIKNYPLHLEKNMLNSKAFFYQLPLSSDYIIKYQKKIMIYDEVKEFLLKVNKIKKHIKDIDFPIGYYQEENDIRGMIIPYYINSPSLYTISETKDINELSKYYYHDDDVVHNLFLLFLDILNLIEELCDYEIYYTDIHRGNFVIYENAVKLIDFDFKYIFYTRGQEDFYYKAILYDYEHLLFKLIKMFDLYELPIYTIKSIDKMKKHVLKVENKVRKNLKGR